MYKHYGLNHQEYETNLVIVDGQLFEKMYGALIVFQLVGYPWRFLSILKILPSWLLDFLYERIAKNRYALFGKQDQCLVLTKELQARLVGCDG